MIREIMNSHDLVTCEPDAKLVDVAKLMADREVGSVLVLTRGRPRGMITDRDLVVRCLAQNLDATDTTVENILTESLATCPETAGLYDCIEKMKEARVRRLPVVDAAGKVVGMISFEDILAVLSKEFVEITSSAAPSHHAA